MSVIVNYSVPEEVKLAFDQMFAHRNKSRIISKLMRHAVEEEQNRQRRATAIDKLLKLRKLQEPIANKDIKQARRIIRK